MDTLIQVMQFFGMGLYGIVLFSSIFGLMFLLCKLFFDQILITKSKK